ncbi:MAG: PKD domain-containing protein, partial [Bacteroidota bacterium]
MKTRPSLYVLLFALSYFFSAHLTAQVIPPTISGPTELCAGDCGVYSLDSLGGGSNSEWFMDYNGLSFVFEGSPQEVCFDEPGVAIFTVFFFDDLGNTFTLNYTVVIGDGISLEIISDSSCPPPDSSANSCEKVCAYSTVTYSVPGNLSSEVEWDITGADNFTVDGNSVTVEWGEPGTGLVEANVEPTSCDLELNCGGACSELNNGLCSAYAEASCGVPPYVYAWSNGENAAIINWLDPGYYEVTVTDATGAIAVCGTEVFYTQECGPGITGQVTQTSSCLANVCDGAIDITPLGGIGTVYTYFWVGSNGFVSTEEDLVGICSGTYSVTLTDDIGCISTRTFQLDCGNDIVCERSASLCVEILEEPEAIFSTSPPIENGVINICEGQTVYFTNESLNAEHFTWDFGPGQSFNDLNSFYTYTNAGTYTVSLIAANECFCADTTSIIVEVEDAIGPEVDCVGTICEGEVITYTSSDACGTFNWTISSNGTITEGGGTGDNFVTVSWGDGPIGTIELAVDNCTGDYCTEPTIAQVPIISDNAEIEGLTRVCNLQTATYTMPLYSGTEYLWTVSSNGTIESGLNTHEITVQWESNSLPNLNQYVAVEYDNCYLGCGGMDTLEVNILPEYYLTGPIEACENEATLFSAINAEDENSMVLANWTIIAPDGTIAGSSTMPSGQFAATWTAGLGQYQIQIEAANLNDYCTDSHTLKVTVVAPPAPVTGINGATEICPGQFYAYQAISPNPANQFRWQIDDGGTLTEQMGNPINVVWTSGGPYSLSVTEISVTGPACESDPTTLAINPIQSFAINETADACRDETAVYTATGFQDVNYTWSIVPAAAGTVIAGQNTTNPEVLWHQAGIYDLQLAICGQVEIITVEVHDKPEPTVLHPIGLCVGETGQIQTSTLYSSYTWYNESGTIVSTLADPNLGPGYYELVVEDNFGCEEDTTFFIDPYPLPDINISTPDNTWFCPGQTPPTLYALETEDGYS